MAAMIHQPQLFLESQRQFSRHFCCFSTLAPEPSSFFSNSMILSTTSSFHVSFTLAPLIDTSERLKNTTSKLHADVTSSTFLIGLILLTLNKTTGSPAFCTTEEHAATTP